MTMNLNAPPPSLASEQIHEDHDQPYPQLFGPNYRVTSSSSSGSCHIFLNSAQDHTGYYHHQLYHHDHKEDDHTYAYSGGSSSYEIKNKAETSILKLTLWKKEPDHDHCPEMVTHEMINHKNPVKWMSSKMRLIRKKKTNPDRRALKITKTKIDHHHDHKLQRSPSFETNDSSTKISSYNNNNPIRVCSDCNTTKTPLWRSGPKGPKSLCNACGIRHRKARRALAAAGNGAGVASDQTTTALKIKVENKEKNIKNVPLKKRYKLDAAASSTSGGLQSNNGQKIEDFLINFSKNLAFHRMFPEDEKDAAILLMALSSGLIHG